MVGTFLPPTNAELLKEQYGTSTSAVLAVSLIVTPAGERSYSPTSVVLEDLGPNKHFELLVEWWNAAAGELLGCGELHDNASPGKAADVTQRLLAALEPELALSLALSLARSQDGASATAQVLPSRRFLLHALPCRFIQSGRQKHHSSTAWGSQTARPKPRRNWLLGCFQARTAPTDREDDHSATLTRDQRQKPTKHANPVATLLLQMTPLAQRMMPQPARPFPSLAVDMPQGPAGGRSSASNALASLIASYTQPDCGSGRPGPTLFGTGGIDAICLAGLPLCVTMFSLNGRICHQNAASREYFGKRTVWNWQGSFRANIGSLTALGGSTAARTAGCSDLPRQRPTGCAEPVSLLTALEQGDLAECGAADADALGELFVLDFTKLGAMLSVTATAGAVWEGILRVPCTLNPDAPSASATPCVTGGSQDDGGIAITSAGGQLQTGFDKLALSRACAQDESRLVREDASSTARPSAGRSSSQQPRMTRGSPQGGSLLMLPLQQQSQQQQPPGSGALLPPASGGICGGPLTTSFMRLSTAATAVSSSNGTGGGGSGQVGHRAQQASASHPDAQAASHIEPGPSRSDTVDVGPSGVVDSVETQGTSRTTRFARLSTGLAALSPGGTPSVVIDTGSIAVGSTGGGNGQGVGPGGGGGGGSTGAAAATVVMNASASSPIGASQKTSIAATLRLMAGLASRTTRRLRLLDSASAGPGAPSTTAMELNGTSPPRASYDPLFLVTMGDPRSVHADDNGPDFDIVPQLPKKFHSFSVARAPPRPEPAGSDPELQPGGAHAMAARGSASEMVFGVDSSGGNPPPQLGAIRRSAIAARKSVHKRYASLDPLATSTWQVLFDDIDNYSSVHSTDVGDGIYDTDCTLPSHGAVFATEGDEQAAEGTLPSPLRPGCAKRMSRGPLRGRFSQPAADTTDTSEPCGVTNESLREATRSSAPIYIPPVNQAAVSAPCEGAAGSAGEADPAAALAARGATDPAGQSTQISEEREEEHLTDKLQPLEVVAVGRRRSSIMVSPSGLTVGGPSVRVGSMTGMGSTATAAAAAKTSMDATSPLQQHQQQQQQQQTSTTQQPQPQRLRSGGSVSARHLLSQNAAVLTPAQAPPAVLIPPALSRSFSMSRPQSNSASRSAARTPSLILGGLGPSVQPSPRVLQFASSLRGAPKRRGGGSLAAPSTVGFGSVVGSSVGSVGQNHLAAIMGQLEGVGTAPEPSEEPAANADRPVSGVASAVGASRIVRAAREMVSAGQGRGAGRDARAGVSGQGVAASGNLDWDQGTTSIGLGSLGLPTQQEQMDRVRQYLDVQAPSDAWSSGREGSYGMRGGRRGDSGTSGRGRGGGGRGRALEMDQAATGAAGPTRGGNHAGTGVSGNGFRKDSAGVGEHQQRHLQQEPAGQAGDHADDDGGSEGNAAKAAQEFSWHEVRATCILNPHDGMRYLLLVQKDVTAKVEAERHIAQVSECEHRLLEQIFPRHVLAYMTEEGFLPNQQQQQPQELDIDGDQLVSSTACSGPNNAPVSGTGDGGGGDGVKSPLTRNTAWRPYVRDCTRLATWHTQVTILFADVQGFTPMCKQLPPTVVMKFLNDLFVRFDAQLDKYGVYKVETIGDCYVVAGGLIQEDADGMAAVQGDEVDRNQAVKVFGFAQAMLRSASRVTNPTTGLPVKIRVGIHSGPVVSGVVGTRMPRFCLFGDTINTASRMESTGVPGSIHVSNDTFHLLPSGQDGWAATGGIEVKGKGLMETYLWNPAGGAPQSAAAGAAAGAGTAGAAAAAAAAGAAAAGAAAAGAAGAAAAGVNGSRGGSNTPQPANARRSSRGAGSLTADAADLGQSAPAQRQQQQQSAVASTGSDTPAPAQQPPQAPQRTSVARAATAASLADSKRKPAGAPAVRRTNSELSSKRASPGSTAAGQDAPVSRQDAWGAGLLPLPGFQPYDSGADEPQAEARRLVLNAQHRLLKSPQDAAGSSELSEPAGVLSQVSDQTSLLVLASEHVLVASSQTSGQTPTASPSSEVPMQIPLAKQAPPPGLPEREPRARVWGHASFDASRVASEPCDSIRRSAECPGSSCGGATAAAAAAGVAAGLKDPPALPFKAPAADVGPVHGADPSRKSLQEHVLHPLYRRTSSDAADLLLERLTFSGDVAAGEQGTRAQAPASECAESAGAGGLESTIRVASVSGLCSGRQQPAPGSPAGSSLSSGSPARRQHHYNNTSAASSSPLHCTDSVSFPMCRSSEGSVILPDRWHTDTAVMVAAAAAAVAAGAPTGGGVGGGAYGGRDGAHDAAPLDITLGTRQPVMAASAGLGDGSSGLAGGSA